MIKTRPREYMIFRRLSKVDDTYSVFESAFAFEQKVLSADVKAASLAATRHLPLLLSQIACSHILS